MVFLFWEFWESNEISLKKISFVFNLIILLLWTILNWLWILRILSSFTGEQMSCSEHLFILSISSWEFSRKISPNSFLMHQDKNYRWKHLEIYWQNKIFSLLSFFFFFTDEMWMLHWFLVIYNICVFDKICNIENRSVDCTKY